jgi:hypothetical protein
VVVHPHDPAVLAARRDGALALPETERPGQVWTAFPAEVLPALDELLDADALLLDCLDDHQDPAARVQRATLLAVPRQTPALPQGMAWVGRDDLAGADAALAARVVEALERPGGDGGQPWAARGWFAEAEGWLRSTMERLGRPVTGTVRQARVWRLSCVLRAPTGDGDVWFKANTTSPLFVNEGVVMGALAGLFPGQVPAPLAVEPERGWMVLADFGEEVGWEVPLEVVEEVARAYARMRVEATVLRLDRRLCGPPVPRPGHDPAGHGLRRRHRRGRAAGAAGPGLPARVGRVRAAPAPGRGLGAGRPAGRPAPGGQLPVVGRPAPRGPHMAQSTAWWLRQVLAGLA